MSAAAVFDLEELEEVTARCYLRVSRDESGRARSNTEQYDEAGRAVERKRWHLGESYEDVGSASSRKRKRRADFDALMADLRADTFGAHVLIVWEASRGSREVPEWYALLGLLQQRGVFVFVTSLYRLFNPRVAYDWKALMDMATQAEFEVLQLLERQERATKADAEAGRWKGGRRPFGYEPDGVTIRRGQVEGTLNEEALILEAVKRVTVDHERVRSIAADWNRRGILTTAGNLWHPGSLRNLLASPRIAGRRVHKGRVMDGPAEWPGIIDEVTHKRVVATLKSWTPVGRRGRTPALLTGLLYCSRCGAHLTINTGSANSGKPGKRSYVCRKGAGFKGCGGLTIKADYIERELGRLMVSKMRPEELAEAEARPEADDAPYLADLDRITVARAELAEARHHRTHPMSMDQYLAEAAVLDRQQAEANEAIAAIARARRPSPAEVIESLGLGLKPWHQWPDDKKRVALEALIDRVVVGPAMVQGRQAFDPLRLKPAGGGGIHWRHVTPVV